MEKTKNFVLVNSWDVAPPPLVWLICMVDDGNVSPLPGGITRDEVHRVNMNYLQAGGTAYGIEAILPTNSVAVDFSVLPGTAKILVAW